MIFQENIHLFKYGRVNIQIMNYFQDSTFPPAVSVRDALRSLKHAILSSQGDVITQTDPETREFLLTWLKNNKPDYATNLYNSQVINNPLLVRVFQDGGRADFQVLPLKPRDIIIQIVLISTILGKNCQYL